MVFGRWRSNSDAARLQVGGCHAAGPSPRFRSSDRGLPASRCHTDAGGVAGNDLYALKHRNGLVVVGLAHAHAAIVGEENVVPSRRAAGAGGEGEEGANGGGEAGEGAGEDAGVGAAAAAASSGADSAGGNAAEAAERAPSGGGDDGGGSVLPLGLSVDFVVRGEDRRALAAEATGKVRGAVLGVGRLFGKLAHWLCALVLTVTVFRERQRKRKGQRRMRPGDALAIVRCGAGREFDILALAEGTLLEVNERLLRRDVSKGGVHVGKEGAELLRRSPQWRGFVGVIMVHQKGAGRLVVGGDSGGAGAFLSLDQYEALRQVSPADSPFR